MNYSNVTVVGRLSRDPETKSFPTGGKIINLGVAVNKRVKNHGTGQYEDKPVWLTAKIFGDRLDGILAHLSKGSGVIIGGKLDQDTWTDPSGNKREKVYIVVDSLAFNGSNKKTEGENGQAASSTHRAGTGNSSQAYATAPATTTLTPTSDPFGSPGSYEDNPF